ncbi:glycosyltransferase [Nocardia sp. NRRL S-836]|uniref:glycosyltransferase n=1 Tax=Nocardia sp. NRRL S-836 TaxID=1519492 RepID=UPI0006C39725|nr:glycosyltransferase [Nocardia sp. NRRL S-836]KOV85158.1 glycosyl transferase [Nocardia sp. NRRL S-836]
MRVLHVISEMGAGGAEAVVAGMACAGPDVDWESAVATAGGFRVAALREAGVPVFDVPPARRSARGVARAAWAVSAAVRRFRPDIVLAHNVSASLVARLGAVRLPVVTVFHGVAEADVPGAVRVLRRVSNRVVAVASASADRLRAAGLEAVVIPNAVFPSAPGIDRATVRAALGTPADAPVALCPARLEPQKRHDVLLDAWALVGGPAELWLAGDGSLRGALEDQARRIRGRVRFLGTRTDVRDLLEAADVTVLTSDWEGMPIALLESLAAERPVVASDVDGVREVLSGGGGILVPRRSPVETAKALHSLLYSPVARSVATARDGSADAHTLMKSYDELLRTVLEARRR